MDNQNRRSAEDRSKINQIRAGMSTRNLRKHGYRPKIAVRRESSSRSKSPILMKKGSSISFLTKTVSNYTKEVSYNKPDSFKYSFRASPNILISSMQSPKKSTAGQDESRMFLKDASKVPEIRLDGEKRPPSEKIGVREKTPKSTKRSSSGLKNSILSAKRFKKNKVMSKLLYLGPDSTKNTPKHQKPEKLQKRKKVNLALNKSMNLDRTLYFSTRPNTTRHLRHQSNSYKVKPRLANLRLSHNKLHRSKGIEGRNKVLKGLKDAPPKPKLAHTPLRLLKGPKIRSLKNFFQRRNPSTTDLHNTSYCSLLPRRIKEEPESTPRESKSGIKSTKTLNLNSMILTEKQRKTRISAHQADARAQIQTNKTTQIQNLTSKNQELRKNLKTKNEENSRLSKEISNLRDQIRHLKGGSELHDQELSGLHQKLTKSSSRIKIMEKDCQNMQSLLKAKNVEIKLLRSMNEDQSSFFESGKREFNQSGEELPSHENNKFFDKRGYFSSMEVSVGDLEDSLNDYRVRVKSLEAEVTELRRENQKFRKTEQKLKNCLEQKEEELDVIKLQLQDIEDDVVLQLQSKMNMILAENESLIQKLQIMTEKMTLLLDNNDELLERERLDKERIQELELKLSAKNGASDNKDETIIKLRSDIWQLRSLVDASEIEKRDISINYGRSEKKIQNLERVLDSSKSAQQKDLGTIRCLEDKISQMASELEGKAEEVMSLKVKNLQLGAEVEHGSQKSEKLGIEVENLTEKLKILENQNNRLKSELEEGEGRIRELVSANEGLDKACAELREQLGLAADQIEGFEETFKIQFDSRDEFEKRISELSQACREAENREILLKSELDAQKSKSDFLTSENSKHCSRLDEALRSNSQLELTKEQLEAELNRLKFEIEGLETNFHRMDDKEASFKQLVLEGQQREAQLKQKIADLEALNNTKKLKIFDLEKHQKSMQGQLYGLNDELNTSITRISIQKHDIGSNSQKLQIAQKQLEDKDSFIEELRARIKQLEGELRASDIKYHLLEEESKKVILDWHEQLKALEEENNQLSVVSKEKELENQHLIALNNKLFLRLSLAYLELDRRFKSKTGLQAATQSTKASNRPLRKESSQGGLLTSSIARTSSYGLPSRAQRSNLSFDIGGRYRLNDSTCVSQIGTGVKGISEFRRQDLSDASYKY